MLPRRLRRQSMAKALSQEKGIVRVGDSARIKQKKMDEGERVKDSKNGGRHPYVIVMTHAKAGPLREAGEWWVDGLEPSIQRICQMQPY